MDSWGKFEETTIAPKDVFYWKIDLEGICDEDYVHVQEIWEVYKTENPYVYHDLYLQCDTVLLADVFESFRNTCI